VSHVLGGVLDDVSVGLLGSLEETVSVVHGLDVLLDRGIKSGVSGSSGSGSLFHVGVGVLVDVLHLEVMGDGGILGMVGGFFVVFGVTGDVVVVVEVVVGGVLEDNGLLVPGMGLVSEFEHGFVNLLSSYVDIVGVVVCFLGSMEFGVGFGHNFLGVFPSLLGLGLVMSGQVQCSHGDSVVFLSLESGIPGKSHVESGDVVGLDGGLVLNNP